MGEERVGEPVDKSKEILQPRDKINDFKKKVKIRMTFWYTSNYHS